MVAEAGRRAPTSAMAYKKMAAIAFDKGSPASRTWPEAQAREQSHHFLQCLLGAVVPGEAHFEMKKKKIIVAI